jgi:tRNA-Thr(GGU) m(6)t(6)A37 methyltransferase TsaA
MQEESRMSTDTTASLRAGEVTVAAPDHGDASLFFIGRIHTPWPQSRDCPRQGDHENGPVCRIEVNEPWRAALRGLEGHSYAQILYWMHLARRDLVLQSPRSNGETVGTFAIRSPNRPNPVSSSLVEILEVGADHVLVRGLDCVDGTPLVDIKPERCPEAPRPKGA